MTKIEAFDRHSVEYDQWFIRNKDVYLSELNMLRDLIPPRGFGVEIGVGTGRFASPLGVEIGVEPSWNMAFLSKQRNLQVVRAVAENLPFRSRVFDFALMVTVICFVDDLLMVFKEAYRVLKNNGFIVVGFIDRDSQLGRRYQLRKKHSGFYKNAVFYATETVTWYVEKTGFEIVKVKKTIPVDTKKVKTLRGDSFDGFVVLKAVKKE